MADYNLQYQDTYIDALLATANELKTAGYIYKGVATPSTNPGTPSERVAYLASEPGTYTNFGGIVIASGLYSLTYANGTWTATQMQAGSDIEVVQTLGQSTSDVMSQKAVTDKLIKVVEKDIQITAANMQAVGLSTDPSKKWKSTYTSNFYPVNGGEEYSITAKDDKVCIFVLLKTFYFKLDASYANNIATGFTDRVVVTAGTTYKLTIPDDCTCLCVQATAGTGDITPKSIIRQINTTIYDELPTIESNRLVKSGGVARQTHVLKGLVLLKTISGMYLNNNMVWVGSAQSSWALYEVTPDSTICVQANSGSGVTMAFLRAFTTPTINAVAAAASTRLAVPLGETQEFVVPHNALYLVLMSVSTSGVNTSPIGIGEYVSADLTTMPLKDILYGDDVQAVCQDWKLENGRIYRVSLDNTNWSISSNMTQNQVKLGIGTDNSIVRCLRDDIPDKECYFIYNDYRLRVAIRASQGSSVSYTIKDVTDNFNKLVYDVHFVDNETYMESCMVKVGVGDLIKYHLNVAANTTPIKMYSRAVRNDTYLVHSVSAESDGVLDGQYMPKQDVFVVMQSVVASGFTPSLRVYNYGEDNGKIVLPYQLLFDTDNKFEILSPTDAEASIYDNKLINYGQIIPYNGIYYLLYQGFGTYHTDSSNILLAYSQDGMTWTRGIPEGVEPPVAGTNVIFRRGTIVGEFSTEVVNEFGVCRVNDMSYPYRMFASIRNDNPNTIVGECNYLFKSSDLVHWEKIRKVEAHAHDSFASLISYGDKIKAYLRMWDYTQELTNQRMIGEMWFDIWGNVIVPPSGIGGRGLYNPAAVSIGADRDLMIPTHFIVTSGMVGDNTYECYINDKGNVRWSPCYNIDRLKDVADNDGWGWGSGLVSIGLNQYYLYSQRDYKHGATIGNGNSSLRLCPLKWITYDSYNQDGEG